MSSSRSQPGYISYFLCTISRMNLYIIFRLVIINGADNVYTKEETWMSPSIKFINTLLLLLDKATLYCHTCVIHFKDLVVTFFVLFFSIMMKPTFILFLFSKQLYTYHNIYRLMYMKLIWCLYISIPFCCSTGSFSYIYPTTIISFAIGICTNIDILYIFII